MAVFPGPLDPRLITPGPEATAPCEHCHATGRFVLDRSIRMEVGDRTRIIETVELCTYCGGSGSVVPPVGITYGAIMRGLTPTAVVLDEASAIERCPSTWEGHRCLLYEGHLDDHEYGLPSETAPVLSDAPCGTCGHPSRDHPYPGITPGPHADAGRWCDHPDCGCTDWLSLPTSGHPTACGCDGHGIIPGPDGHPIPCPEVWVWLGWDHPDADPIGDITDAARALREGWGSPAVSGEPALGPCPSKRYDRHGRLEDCVYSAGHTDPHRFPSGTTLLTRCSAERAVSSGSGTVRAVHCIHNDGHTGSHRFPGAPAPTRPILSDVTMCDDCGHVSSAHPWPPGDTSPDPVRPCRHDEGDGECHCTGWTHDVRSDRCPKRDPEDGRRCAYLYGHTGPCGFGVPSARCAASTHVDGVLRPCTLASGHYGDHLWEGYDTPCASCGHPKDRHLWDPPEEVHRSCSAACGCPDYVEPSAATPAPPPEPVPIGTIIPTPKETEE